MVSIVNDLLLCIAKVVKRFLLLKEGREEGRKGGIQGNFVMCWICLLP